MTAKAMTLKIKYPFLKEEDITLFLPIVDIFDQLHIKYHCGEGFHGRYVGDEYTHIYNVRGQYKVFVNGGKNIKSEYTTNERKMEIIRDTIRDNHAT